MSDVAPTIETFQYQLQDIHVIFKLGTLWFVQAEMNKTLGHPERFHSKTLLPTERDKANVRTIHGLRFVKIINEAGLAKLMKMSTTDKAEPLQKWIEENVRPLVSKAEDIPHRSSSLVHIGSHDVAPLTYREQRVVTFEMIDTLHEKSLGQALRLFTKNRQRFIEGRDFYHLDYNELSLLDLVENPSPNGIHVITESGYLLLVKTFRDDLAWDIQRALVTHYFRSRQPTESSIGHTLTPPSQPMSPDLQSALQIIAQGTQALMGRAQQHEEAITELSQGYISLRQDIDTLKSQREVGTGFVRIMGYAKLKKCRCSVLQAQAVARYAKKRCEELGIERGEVPDETYGTVKTYPIEVLDAVWPIVMGRN